jgi:large subunit ribosomal protein L3
MLELVGKKIGMTHLFEDNARSIPLTMIKLYDNCIVDFSVNENKDYDSLLIAFQKVLNIKKVSKSVAGVYAKKSLPTFKQMFVSKVKKGLSLKAGDSIDTTSILEKGDKVSIRGVTIGKGFAGVMKRWNFRGLEASHGVSVSHRSHGSTGQRQDPGKTFRGKKMAGHMGVKNVTIKNLEIVLIDKENSVIGVKGSIPGNAGSKVILKIAKGF